MGGPEVGEALDVARRGPPLGVFVLPELVTAAMAAQLLHPGLLLRRARAPGPGACLAAVAEVGWCPGDLRGRTVPGSQLREIGPTHGGPAAAILSPIITRLQALNFRCLRHIDLPLDAFHVLVGPNASGKTTFLDVVAFLGDLVSEGIEAAVGHRTANFEDLTWRREGGSVEFAIEALVPDHLRSEIDPPHDRVRYEVSLVLEPDSQEIRFGAETVSLKGDPVPEPAQTRLFPNPPSPPPTILEGSRTSPGRTVVNKVPGGNDIFYSETYEKEGKGWVPAFKLGPRRSALANLPEDESKYPVATWLKSLLAEGVQQLMLNSLLIRQASPPGQGRTFRPDGSNLPWVVEELERKEPRRIEAWIRHLQTALPDLVSIRTVERPDDRHRYLMLGYRGDIEVPSWMASDGTLRLLALTLPAYLSELSGIYLIEEPENGIHPRAVETMFQSLSSVYDAQILLATHSPVILSLVEAGQLLCFAKTEDGATDIVRGSKHPRLQQWQGATDLSTLFASGVIGYGE